MPTLDQLVMMRALNLYTYNVSPITRARSLGGARGWWRHDAPEEELHANPYFHEVLERQSNPNPMADMDPQTVIAFGALALERYEHEARHWFAVHGLEEHRG